MQNPPNNPTSMPLAEIAGAIVASSRRLVVRLDELKSRLLGAPLVAGFSEVQANVLDNLLCVNSNLELANGLLGELEAAVDGSAQVSPDGPPRSCSMGMAGPQADRPSTANPGGPSRQNWATKQQAVPPMKNFCGAPPCPSGEVRVGYDGDENEAGFAAPLTAAEINRTKQSLASLRDALREHEGEMRRLDRTFEQLMSTLPFEEQSLVAKACKRS